MKFRVILLLFFISGFITLLPAQEDSPILMNLRGRYGYVMKHHPTMGHLQTDRFSLWELSAIKRFSDTSSWASYRNYPELGLTLLYTSLGKNPYLGDATALFPSASFYWIDTRSHHLKFRFGAGLGWLSKTYDRTENYRNNAIGSHLNIALDAGLTYAFQFQEKFDAEIGLGLTHFSNGSLKKPNKGINIPNIYGGIRYNLRQPIDHEARKAPRLNSFLLQAGLSAGIKQTEQDINNLYSVYMLNLTGIYRFNMNTGFSLGYDLLHDRSDPVVLESHHEAPEGQNFFLKHGLSAGIHMYFSKISFSVKSGYYLYALENSKGNIYNIYHLFYDLGQGYGAGFNLQAHLARANFISIGIEKTWQL